MNTASQRPSAIDRMIAGLQEEAGLESRSPKEVTEKYHELKRQVAEAMSEIEHERELRSQFINALSHDLRNPLTAAKAATQMIARQATSPERVINLSVRAVESIDRIDRMIHDLLDSNRIRAGQPVPLRIEDCDLAAVARQVIDELTSIHGERFALIAPELGTPGIRGRWDADNLRRVIENLLTNAIKYGAEGSKVTVRVQREDGFASCAVHNFGNPIPDSARERLFLPYQRLKATAGKKGWGIGLTLVRGVVEAHGGRIRVESSAETGTTFTVLLPAFPLLPTNDAIR